MRSIIYTEWLKVKSYRTFWLMAGLLLIVIPAGNFILADNLSGNLQQIKNLVGDPFSFPTVWLTMAAFDSYISPLPGFLLIILVTNEFTFRTNRQNIIDGWERKEFVYSKLYWLFLLAVTTLILATVMAALIGWNYGADPFSFAEYKYMIYYFLQIVVMLTIALVIATFTRRAGVAIIIFSAYLMMGDQLLSFLLKKYVGKVGGLLPIQAGDELLPFPLVGKIINANDKYDESIYVIVMLAYIALGIWLVFRKLLKKDL